MVNYSFIIPHHNIPILLNRCLDSIPVREDVQVIVVDDNSDEDKKPKVLRPSTEVIFIDSNSSNGAGKARNVGLNSAIGKWVLFADADDFFVDDIINILDCYKERNEDIVYFNFKRCENDDTNIILPGDNDALFSYCKRLNDYRYFRVCFSSPWAKMFKNNHIKNNKIEFQELKANNDTLFVVKSGLAAKSILAVNRNIYWYVQRMGSIAHNAGVEAFSKVLDRAIAQNSVQGLLAEYEIKTRIYLPTLISMSLLKHNFLLSFKLCRLARLNVMRFYIDAIKYILLRMKGCSSLQGPNNYNMSRCVLPNDL